MKERNKEFNDGLGGMIGFFEAATEERFKNLGEELVK